MWRCVGRYLGYLLTLLAAASSLVQVRASDSKAIGIQCFTDSLPAERTLSHPRTGSTRALVVFVRFVDDDLVRMCSAGWPDTLPLSQLPAWAGSFIEPDTVEPFTEGGLTDFFWQMSDGQFLLYGDIYDTVVVLDSSSFYPTYRWCSGLTEANKDVVEYLDADPDVEFARYDTHPQDGVLDALFVVYRWSPWWLDPFPFCGYGGLFYPDTTVIVDDSIHVIGGLNESGLSAQGRNPFDIRCVVGHEYTHHLLGPNPPGATDGHGHWDELDRFGLMPSVQDGGNWMSAFERMCLGWIVPDTVRANTYGLEIGDMLTTGDVYMIPVAQETIPGNPDTTCSEYLLLENRQGASYYEQCSSSDPCQWCLPGTGLLITHVLLKDPPRPPSSQSPKSLDIECADGAYDDDTQEPDGSCGIDWLEWREPHWFWFRRGGGHADSSDTFSEQNGTAFTLYTVPGTKGYVIPDRCDDAPPRFQHGDSSGIGVVNIATGPGSSVTCDILFSMEPGKLGTTTTWDGFILLDGDLTVESGDTLLVSPGTTVRLADSTDTMNGGVDPEQVEIIVEGTLLAQGTSDSFIRFLPDSCNWAHEAYEPETPSAGDWYGIVVRAGGRAVLEHCEIGYGTEGVRADSAGIVTLRSSYVHHQSRCALAVCGDAAATVDSSEISLSTHGVWADSGATVLLQHSKLHDNDSSGVYLYKPALAQVESCTIRDNLYTGIWIENGNPRIEDCRITNIDSFGVFVAATDSARMRSCVLDSNTTHVKTADEDLDLGNMAWPGPGPGNAGWNAFTAGTTCLENTDASADSLLAHGNYWGSDDSSSVASRISGNVDYDPWLPLPPDSISAVFSYAEVVDHEGEEIDFVRGLCPILHSQWDCPEPDSSLSAFILRFCVKQQSGQAVEGLDARFLFATLQSDTLGPPCRCGGCLGWCDSMETFPESTYSLCCQPSDHILFATDITDTNGISDFVECQVGGAARLKILAHAGPITIGDTVTVWINSVDLAPCGDPDGYVKASDFEAFAEAYRDTAWWADFADQDPCYPGGQRKSRYLILGPDFSFFGTHYHGGTHCSCDDTDCRCE